MGFRVWGLEFRVLGLGFSLNPKPHSGLAPLGVCGLGQVLFFFGVLKNRPQTPQFARGFMALGVGCLGFDFLEVVQQSLGLRVLGFRV